MNILENTLKFLKTLRSLKWIKHGIKFKEFEYYLKGERVIATKNMLMKRLGHQSFLLSGDLTIDDINTLIDEKVYVVHNNSVSNDLETVLGFYDEVIDQKHKQFFNQQFNLKLEEVLSDLKAKLDVINKLRDALTQAEATVVNDAKVLPKPYDHPSNLRFMLDKFGFIIIDLYKELDRQEFSELVYLIPPSEFLKDLINLSNVWDMLKKDPSGKLRSILEIIEDIEESEITLVNLEKIDRKVKIEFNTYKVAEYRKAVNQIIKKKLYRSKGPEIVIKNPEAIIKSFEFIRGEGIISICDDQILAFLPALGSDDEHIINRFCFTKSQVLNKKEIHIFKQLFQYWYAMKYVVTPKHKDGFKILPYAQKLSILFGNIKGFSIHTLKKDMNNLKPDNMDPFTFFKGNTSFLSFKIALKKRSKIKVST